MNLVIKDRRNGEVVFRKSASRPGVLAAKNRARSAGEHAPRRRSSPLERNLTAIGGAGRWLHLRIGHPPPREASGCSAGCSMRSLRRSSRRPPRRTTRRRPRAAAAGASSTPPSPTRHATRPLADAAPGVVPSDVVLGRGGHRVPSCRRAPRASCFRPCDPLLGRRHRRRFPGPVAQDRPAEVGRCTVAPSNADAAEPAVRLARG